MDKKFYRVDDGWLIINVNIDYVTKWRIDYEGELHIALSDGARYDIPCNIDEKGYNALLKALKERTVG